MRRVMRSPVVVAVALLTASAGGAAAHAVPSGAASPRPDAPACVEVGPGWRYTLVTNGCSGTLTLTVVYGDGQEVPCRVAHPGDRLTFPGYGTRDDRVLGAALCSDGSEP